MNLPEPGERPPAPASFVLTQREVATLLADAAGFTAIAECPNGPDCENCNAHHGLWWDLCVLLDRPVRVKLQAFLRARGIPLPDGPWTEETRNVRQEGE
jgi:hypothetical protein